jgi:TMEM175 potassium channel family protein
MTPQDGTPNAPQADDPWTIRRYPREGNGAGFDRLIFFSDAVFAIALTLAAVEIGIPEIEDPSPSALWEALVSKGPQLVGYLVAFLWVAFYWRANHAFTATLKAISSRYIVAVLGYLALVAFLPIPAALLGEYLDNPVAVAVFAVFAALLSAMEVVLWVVADRDDLFLVPPTPTFRRQAILGSLTPVPAFLISIPVGFVLTPGAAILTWFVVSVGLGWLVSRLVPASAP